MSKVISFLETMGQDAHLRHATDSELELPLNRAQIAPDLQAAILSGDQTRVQALLGAKTNVVCAIFPGKEDDEGEESPSKDDDEISLHSAAR